MMSAVNLYRRRTVTEAVVFVVGSGSGNSGGEK